MIDTRLKSKDWRVENLYKIVDKNSKLIKFKKNNVQNSFEEKRHTRNIILKARQLGFTTNACIGMLDEVLFNRNVNAVIIAHEQESLKKIFKKVKLAWDSFPLKETMGYEAKTDRANELSFNNGSTIGVALSSRADTVNWLHVSELAPMDKKYPLKSLEVIAGALPSVPEGGRIDIESTGELSYGIFHDMFWDAYDRNEEPAQKQFKAFFFPWTDDSKYQMNGDYNISEDLKSYGERYKLTKEQLNWYKFEKETQKDLMMSQYPTTPEEAFLSSGNKLFDSDKLSRHTVEEGKKVNDWIYYEEYKPSHRYGIGADVAEGVGQDSSTAVIIDFTLSKVVAEFESNKIAPDIFAHELKNAGLLYGGCIIAPESNNVGFTTINKLKEIYGNVYKHEVKDGKLDVWSGQQARFKYGWETNKATKPNMLYDLNDAINEDLIKIPSKKILKELRTYDKEDLSITRFDPDQTNHWDRVIALAIAWQMKDKVEKRNNNKVYSGSSNL